LNAPSAKDAPSIIRRSKPRKEGPCVPGIGAVIDASLHAFLRGRDCIDLV
jgi:hypothetical protein